MMMDNATDFKDEVCNDRRNVSDTQTFSFSKRPYFPQSNLHAYWFSYIGPLIESNEHSTSDILT